MQTNSDLLKGFETKLCGRCGGCGQHSYCQMYGTTCFGCGGTGVKLTKRGCAAKLFLSESRSKVASNLKLGMYIKIHGFRKWHKITDIHASKSCALSTVNGEEVRRYYTNLVTKVCTQGVFDDTRLEAVVDDAEIKRTFTEALRYQSTLNLKGLVSKKK